MNTHRFGTTGFIVLLFGLMFWAAGGRPVMATDVHVPATPEPSPVVLAIEPLKRIYTAREGLQVRFTLKALDRAKICVEKDILSQMTLRVSRSGEFLHLQPLVVTDNRELFHQHMNVQWLESGQTLTFRANIKRFRLANGETWEPGEYTVSGSFGLCEQTPGTLYDPAGKEAPVPAKNTGWFMIMS